MLLDTCIIALGKFEVYFKLQNVVLIIYTKNASNLVGTEIGLQTDRRQNYIPQILPLIIVYFYRRLFC